MSRKSKTQQLSGIEVEILVDTHTHMGVSCPKGTKLVLSEPTALWMEQHGVGRRTAGMQSPDVSFELDE